MGRILEKNVLKHGNFLQFNYNFSVFAKCSLYFVVVDKTIYKWWWSNYFPFSLYSFCVSIIGLRKRKSKTYFVPKFFLRDAKLGLSQLIFISQSTFIRMDIIIFKALKLIEIKICTGEHFLWCGNILQYMQRCYFYRNS